jgi:hypothetical protein
MRRDLWLTMVGVRDLPRFAGRETLPRTARPLDLLARWGEVIRAPPLNSPIKSARTPDSPATAPGGSGAGGRRPTGPAPDLPARR